MLLKIELYLLAPYKGSPRQTCGVTAKIFLLLTWYITVLKNLPVEWAYFLKFTKCNYFHSTALAAFLLSWHGHSFYARKLCFLKLKNWVLSHLHDSKNHWGNNLWRMVAKETLLHLRASLRWTGYGRKGWCIMGEKRMADGISSAAGRTSCGGEMELAWGKVRRHSLPALLHPQADFK